MISNKCHYALRAMLELAIRQGHGPVTIAEIAAAQNIPARFLEAILRQLRQAGLCDSVRGKEGGYTLSRPAESITLNDVIRLFEGSLVVPPATSGKAQESGEIFKAIWLEAEQAIGVVFDRYKLSHLVDMEHKRAFEKASNYTI